MKYLKILIKIEIQYECICMYNGMLLNEKKNKLFFLFLLNLKCGQLNFDVGPWNNKV